jgi:hypothetical protein
MARLSDPFDSLTPDAQKVYDSAAPTQADENGHLRRRLA